MDRVLGGLLQGKPKNTGAEVLSGSHIPPSWVGTMLSNDFRANRTVRYILEEDGSGYKAEEAETVLFSSHRSYRPVDIKQGPDGAIYIVDWYSPVIDHGEVDFYHPSRDKSHGRIWRLTAKGRPLHPVVNYREATSQQLLNHLKSDYAYDRIQANRELVRRNLPPEDLKSWVSGLSSRDRELAHHQLEALWLSVALNAPDVELLSTLLSSRNHRALAAAIRMVPRMLNAAEGEAALADLVAHRHPKVRLEAVNALRRLRSSKAVELAFQAYDLPRDVNLDYIFWLTARELQDQWLPVLQLGQPVLDNDYHKIVFGLLAVNDSTAAREAGKLFQSGKVPEEDRFMALALMANQGGSSELDLVLNEALQNTDTLLMEALYEAPLTNQATPTDMSGLADLFQSEVEKVRTMGALLSGRWQLEANRPLLIASATNSELNTDERLAAADALSLMEETDLLMALASDSLDLPVRSTAVSALAKLPTSQPDLAVQVLADATDPDEVEVIFDTYIGLVGGADSLAQALQDVKLEESVAIAGIRVAYASGRDLSVLIEALQQTTELQRMGLSFDSAQVSQLMADVAESELTGNGRKIFFKPSLLCASCHRVNGEGGMIGPDLSTVGTYMDPPALLESLINPSSSIKQGYETVIVTKTDGSIVSGTLERRTAEGARIRQPSGKVVNIASGEIESVDNSPVSLMPPGLIGQLRYDEVVDLLTYLSELGADTD